MKEEKSKKNKSSSLSALRMHDICWELLGHSTSGGRILHGIYDALLTILVTVLYPLHLVVGLFFCDTKAEIMENLVIVAATVPCSIKIVAFRVKIPEMKRMKTLLVALDQRVEGPDEKNYFENSLIRSAERMMYLFTLLYPITLISSFISFAMSSHQHLMYPGWFPFDWTRSRRNYLIATSYQCLGLFVAGIQNLSNDMYSPVVLSLMAGHVHLVGMRLAKMGSENRNSEKLYEEEQVACMKDYNNLMSLYKSVESILSTALLAQFLAGAMSIGVGVIYMVLYVNNFYAYMYQGLLLTAYLGQLFPFCYYGTLVAAKFRELPYAIFSSNWLERQRNYRQNVAVFMGLTLPDIIAHAGGMFNIHVDSFFAVCKMAYSLFTVLTATKD